MQIASIRETHRLYILEVLGVEVQCWAKVEGTAETVEGLRDRINEEAARRGLTARPKLSNDDKATIPEGYSAPLEPTTTTELIARRRGEQ